MLFVRGEQYLLSLIHILHISSFLRNKYKTHSCITSCNRRAFINYLLVNASFTASIGNPINVKNCNSLQPEGFNKAAKSYTKVASILISVFKSLDTGQFALASAAHSSNFSLVIPGTFALTVK